MKNQAAQAQIEFARMLRVVRILASISDLTRFGQLALGSLTILSSRSQRLDWRYRGFAPKLESAPALQPRYRPVSDTIVQ